MKNLGFTFSRCLSWKGLSARAWGTVCQKANDPLWQYNLMSVFPGLPPHPPPPGNPVLLRSLVMLWLKLHIFFYFIRILLINAITRTEMKYGGSSSSCRNGQLLSSKRGGAPADIRKQDGKQWHLYCFGCTPVKSLDVTDPRTETLKLAQVL